MGNGGRVGRGQPCHPSIRSCFRAAPALACGRFRAAMYPKQFIRFFETQPASFLAATVARLTPEEGFAKPIVVCNNDHRFLVKDEIGRAGVTPLAIVLEPVARNTAPAIAVAALLVGAREPRGRPGRNAVRPRHSRRAGLRRSGEARGCGRRDRQAGTVSASSRTEHTPATATSAAAIRCRGSRAPMPSMPSRRSQDKAKAETYVAAGTYAWNSGIFVLGAQAFPRTNSVACSRPCWRRPRPRLDGAKEDLGIPAPQCTGVRRRHPASRLTMP